MMTAIVTVFEAAGLTVSEPTTETMVVPTNMGPDTCSSTARDRSSWTEAKRQTIQVLYLGGSIQ